MGSAVAGYARRPVSTEDHRQVEIMRRPHPPALHGALPQQSVGEDRRLRGLAFSLLDTAETEPPIGHDRGIQLSGGSARAAGAVGSYQSFSVGRADVAGDGDAAGKRRFADLENGGISEAL